MKEESAWENIVAWAKTTECRLEDMWFLADGLKIYTMHPPKGLVFNILRDGKWRMHNAIAVATSRLDNDGWTEYDPLTLWPIIESGGLVIFKYENPYLV